MFFKPGDKVTCISRTETWYDSRRGFKEVPGPRFGEILEVACLEDQYFLVFEKYGADGYDPNMFRIVQDPDKEFVGKVIGYIKGEIEENEF